MIPIQINVKPGESCNGYNGKLSSFEYGLNTQYKNKLVKQYNNVGLLAQYDTVNSPYYSNITVDPEYIKFLHNLRNCNKNK